MANLDEVDFDLLTLGTKIMVTLMQKDDRSYMLVFTTTSQLEKRHAQ